MKNQTIGERMNNKITKSTENYNLWKEETRETYYKKFKSKKGVDRFISYISSILDKHQRAYLPRKVMFYLWGKRNWVVKDNQHFWIIILGQKGGEGKSTLADYISMMFDPTYTKDRSQQDYHKWLKVIKQAKKETKYPAVVLDEPDVITHELSKSGRERRNILERVRILRLFACVCANAPNDVPPSLYSKASAIIYINKKHRFWLWDDTKDKPKGTIVDELKGAGGWGKYGYSVFKRPEFTNRACFKNLGFAHPKNSPFKSEQYEVRKEDDVINLIDKHLEKDDGKKRIEGKEDRLIKEIMDLKRRYPKLTDGQIALRLGLSRTWVNLLKNKAIKCQPSPL